MNQIHAHLKQAYYKAYETESLWVARNEFAKQVQSKIPLVSVLIPTHNRSLMLQERSLRSAVTQTYENIEILVLAHGCTDETVDVVKQFSDPRIRFVDVPRQKLGYPDRPDIQWFVAPVKPLNIGCRLASGSFLSVLGDDDIWKPNHLSKSIQYLNNRDLEFVSSLTSKINDDGEMEIIGRDDLNGHVVGGVSTWVYRSYLKLFRWNIDSWKNSWNRPNDYDLATRMINRGVRMGFLNNVGHVWEKRPGQEKLGSHDYFDKMEDG